MLHVLKNYNYITILSATFLVEPNVSDLYVPQVNCASSCNILQQNPSKETTLELLNLDGT